jgi:hypothetical protein
LISFPRSSVSFPAFFLSLLPFLFLFLSCARPCNNLVEKYCACDLAIPENKSACDRARDGAVRKAAEEGALRAGQNIQNICLERLDLFRCPSDGSYDYGPGKWFPGRLGTPIWR